MVDDNTMQQATSRRTPASFLFYMISLISLFVWFFLSLLVLLGGSPEIVTLKPGATRMVDVSSWWHSSYTVNMSLIEVTADGHEINSDFKAPLVPLGPQMLFYGSSQTPQLRNSRKEHINATVIIWPGSMRTWSEYLNQDTIVTVRWSLDAPGIDLFVADSKRSQQKYDYAVDERNLPASGEHIYQVQQSSEHLLSFQASSESKVLISGSVSMEFYMADYVPLFASHILRQQPNVTGNTTFFTDKPSEWFSKHPFYSVPYVVLHNPTSENCTIHSTWTPRYMSICTFGYMIAITTLALIVILRACFVARLCTPEWVIAAIVVIGLGGFVVLCIIAKPEF